jgi:hypothetical protein
VSVDNTDNTIYGLELIALTATYLINTKKMKQQVAQGTCTPAYDCLRTLGQKFIQDMVDMGLDVETIGRALERYLASVSESLPAQQHTQQHTQQHIKITKQLQQCVRSKKYSISMINHQPLYQPLYQILTVQKYKRRI